MNNKIKEAFDQVHASEDLKQHTLDSIYQKTNGFQPRKTFYMRKYAVAMACCLLLFLGASGCYSYFTPVSAISIDINPSVELNINRFDRVINMKGYNKDGEKLADTINVRFLKYSDAIEKILSSDALSAFLAMDAGNPYITYGISEKVMDEKDSHEIREGRFCKKCGEPLHYNFYHYSQLGDYACTSCDFRRPEIQYDASDIQVGDQLSFTVEGRRITANYKGFYNVYNILAAYTAARSGGFALEHFNDMLAKFNPENGRMEQFVIRDTKIVLNLAKNPAGFNQNISAVMQDDTLKDLIIVINDNDQDGTDISWLWDVDFDRFKGANVNSITVSGIRCQDMRLRLKYVDIPSMLEADVEKAICERVENGCGNLYVLVNYTALFSTRNVLKRLEGKK